MSEADNHDEEVNELSAVEEKALERGWKPQEEFEGDPDEWVDAKTFVEKGELMDVIHTERRTVKQLKSELESVKGTVSEVRDHYEKWAKAEIQNKIKELRSAKREALRLDDYEEVDKLDDQIDDIKTEERRLQASEKEDKTTKEPAPLPPEVQSWVAENPWADELSPKYQPDLAQEAIALLQAKVASEGYKGTESLNDIKSKMEKLYPERLKTRQRPATSVDSSDTSPRGNGPKGSLVKKMDDTQRKAAKKFVESGAVESIEEYAKQLKDIGAL